MASLWLPLLLLIMANLMGVEGSSNKTKAALTKSLKSGCHQAKRCTNLGGECYKEDSAPPGLTVVKKGNRKVWCQKKKGCLCYKPAPCPATPVQKNFTFPFYEGCFQYGKGRNGPPVYTFPGVTDEFECQKICKDYPEGCNFFTFNNHTETCLLYNYLSTGYIDTLYQNVSGPSVCIPIPENGTCSSIESPYVGGADIGNFFDFYPCPFSDGYGIQLLGDITQINLQADYGKYYGIQGIQLKYGNYLADLHGYFDPPGPVTCTLSPGTKIMAVTGRAFGVVNQLTFHTTDPSCPTISAGSPTGTPFYASFPDCYLSYISGIVEPNFQVFYTLTFHWECPYE